LPGPAVPECVSKVIGLKVTGLKVMGLWCRQSLSFPAGIS
jgi:hypothetical protein